jgi:hypothetical protein
MTLDTVITFLVGGVISTLLTSFIHNINSRKNIKEVVTEVIDAHEKQYHSVNPIESIKEHVDSCKANERIVRIEKAIIYIVCQLGGNPKELGIDL